MNRLFILCMVMAVLLSTDYGKMETDLDSSAGFLQFKRVMSVTVQDYSGEDRANIILLLEYEDADGQPVYKVRVFHRLCPENVLAG